MKISAMSMKRDLVSMWLALDEEGPDELILISMSMLTGMMSMNKCLGTIERGSVSMRGDPMN